MIVIYPFNPLNEKAADEPYQAEFLGAKKIDIACSLFDYDGLGDLQLSFSPPVKQGDKVLYRGWMLSLEQYQNLHDHISMLGAELIVQPKKYAQCHHITGWIDKLAVFTPETVILKESDDLFEKLDNLNWSSYFAKDYVKSNSTELGSIANTPPEVAEILSSIKNHRGQLEGGITLRKIEDFIEDTELRLFVVDGAVYYPDNEKIDIASDISKCIDSPFYSMDLIKNSKGNYRLVEVGDAQVSDKKSWSVDKFLNVLIAISAKYSSEE